MIEVATSLTDKAYVGLVCSEGMLDPGLPNLFKALAVVRSSAHSIEIVRNDRVIGLWHRKKIHGHVSGIARGRANAQPNLGPATSKLLQASNSAHVSRDDIGPRIKTLRSALRPAGLRGQEPKREQKQRERESFLQHGGNPPFHPAQEI
jgi:hypothetical protein